jgi:probable phosphoglycerate mutase
MELLLIRHALPIRRENVADGPADPVLSEAGHAQSEHLAKYLSTETIDAIYASPLVRARQTAAPVATDQGRTVVIEPGVAEYDKDSDTYIPVEELKAAGDPRWKEMIERSAADNPADFATGVVGSINAIAARHAGEKVAVVCHGGVINAYLLDVLGLEIDGPGFFYPNYTSIHRVMVSRKGIRSVSTINETAHLRGTGLPIGILHP